MSWRIHSSLERFDADTADCVDEALAFFAFAQVDTQDAIDRFRNFGVRNGRPNDLAQCRVRTAGGAADRDLIPLLTAFIDAKDADVTYVVVTASVHATRHLQFD